MPRELPVRLVGRDVLFVHWSVPETAVRPLVPEWLTVDTHGGSAWASALVLEVAGVVVGDRTLPLPPSPQVLFRTYARPADGSGERGVLFLSCDTPGALASALGERRFGLPVRPASVDLRRHEDRVTVRSRRLTDGARFDARYRPTGAAAPADAVHEALLERHVYYGRTEPVVGRVERDPWQVAPAEVEVRTETLFEAVGLDAPTADPVTGYSPRFEPRFLGAARVD